MGYGLVRCWAPHYGVDSFLACTALVLSLSFSLGVFVRCWTWSRPRPHPWAFKELSLRILGSRTPWPGLWALNTKWAGTSDFGLHNTKYVNFSYCFKFLENKTLNLLLLFILKVDKLICKVSVLKFVIIVVSHLYGTEVPRPNWALDSGPVARPHFSNLCFILPSWTTSLNLVP